MLVSYIILYTDADPYPPPSFSLTQLNDDTADIQYSLDEFTNIPDEYLSQFKGVSNT